MKTNTGISLSEQPPAAVRIGIAAVLVITLITAVACKNRAAPSLSPPVETGETRSNPPASYADVVERATPAVVTIIAERRIHPPQQYPFFNDPFFRYFFGSPAPQAQPEQRERALGSGVIVTADGYIATNHHVINGAEDIKIILNDGRTLTAQVIGSDAPSDIAVLKVNERNLPALVFANSDQVRVGDVVLAIGSPLGLRQTVTNGIISAKGRSTDVSDGSFEDFLQTDAPINQGNSGGALLNTNAEMVGINSQILSPTGSFIGIGFAIPSNMAHSVMQQLIANGKVRRGRLGIAVQPVTSDLAASLGLRETRGVIVRQVEKGSPAESAGIHEGDVILAFNGTPVNDANSLRNLVAGAQPGTEVTLTIFRDGQEQQVRATLGEFVPPSAPNQGGE